MHRMLATVETFEELVRRGQDSTPYDYPTMFPADGFWARRASQKRLKLLKTIDEPLRAMLHPGERVLFLTAGAFYSFVESYFAGSIILYANRRAIVLTTERILLLQIDRGGRLRALRSQVGLRSIEAFSRTALGNSVLKLADGRRYTFAYVRRRDRKALSDLTPMAIARATAGGTGQGLEHLCPHCYVPVKNEPAACPSCGGAFKSRRKATLLSLLFPGLGMMYLGHPGIGAFEAFVGALIWFANLTSPGVLTSLPVLITTVILIVLVFHGIDALVTRHIAGKGCYPAGGRPAALGAVAAS